jgi:hypothetical protein
MYYSYIKYYFLKIRQILKYNDFIESNKQFFELIKESINNILEYNQVYRNDILEEIIEDSIDNKKNISILFKYFKRNFFAKTEEFFIESDKNIQSSNFENAKNNLLNSENNFKLSKRLIEKVNDEGNSLKYLKDNIKDFPTKIETRKLIIDIKSGNIKNNIENYALHLINKYLKCNRIIYEDIAFLNSNLNLNKVNIPIRIEDQMLYEINKLKKQVKDDFEILFYFLKCYPPYIQSYYFNNEIKRTQYEEEYNKFHNLNLENIKHKYKNDKNGTINELISLYQKLYRKLERNKNLTSNLERKSIQFRIIIEELNEIKNKIK